MGSNRYERYAPPKTPMEVFLTLMRAPVGMQTLAPLAQCPQCGERSGVETVQAIPVADRRSQHERALPRDIPNDRRRSCRRNADRHEPPIDESSRVDYQCVTCDFEWSLPALQS